jgi:ABC-type uncharacterized transport system involved in gliding motility auxiliary subunit
VSRGRYIKYTANSFIAIIAVLAIISFVNYIASKHKAEIDTTESNRFSLADQTVKVLKGLDQDVTALAFFQGRDLRVDDLLRNYDFHSDHFSYEFVDPDKKPEMARLYNIDKYGTIVLVAGDRDERVEDNNEQGITNTILRVTREQKKVVYFLTGHGERDLENIERTGYSTVKKTIEEQNYDVKTLNLAREDSIPSDCSAIVIASPQTRPFDQELDRIEEYLEGGGSVLVLLDPGSEALKGFLDGWGIEVGDDIVIDASGVGRIFGAGPTIPLISSYENHPITKGFKVMTFFPETRSVDKKENVPSGVRVTSLAKTTKSSWAETEPEGEKYELDEGVDKRGPVSIAAVATKTIEPAGGGEQPGDETGGKKTARLVVYGDSDFASNSYFHASGNSDLFLNTLSWLMEDEDLIAIRPREREDRRLTLTAGQTKKIFYFSIILMPLVIVGIGLVVWGRKR